MGPEAAEVRLTRQHRALLSIGRAWPRYEADVDAAMRAITETAAEALDIDRVSVWLLDPAGAKLVCKDLFEQGPERHSSGAELQAKDFPAYFAALEREEVIAAVDAHSDPRTSEFSASYLGPLGIGAMLDAPIRHGGRAVGVLCHEHIGGAREFFVDEQNTATHLASLVSLALEFAHRRESELELARSLSLLQAAFEATGEAILAVDATGSVTAHNRAAVELWQLTPELLGPAGDRGARLAHIAAQTLEPELFVRRAREVFANHEAESVDMVQLRDGRVIERTSRPQRLEGQVIGRVWSYRDVTEKKRTEDALRASEAALRELAIRDSLTGLYNRRRVHERLVDELTRAKRTGRPFSVALADLDRFKRINDDHGHQVGDEVLKVFAEELRGRLRGSDIVGRYGGEEFLIVLPETPRDAATHLLDEIRVRTGRERTPLPTFTVSIGVAAYPEDGSSCEALIGVADKRLYDAKRLGRNRVV